MPLSRLALTVNYNKEELSRKITAAVTDSVEKNLQIEGLTAVDLLSIYEEFDNSLSNKQKSKKLSLYNERPFGLFGFSAAALSF